MLGRGFIINQVKIDSNNEPGFTIKIISQPKNERKNFRFFFSSLEPNPALVSGPSGASGLGFSFFNSDIF